MIRKMKNENQFLPKANNINENQTEALERPKDIEDSGKAKFMQKQRPMLVQKRH